MIEKTCRTCGHVGPVEEFIKGLNWCKKCKAEYSKTWKKAGGSNTEIRTCNSCGKTASVTEFINHRNTCKICDNKRNNERRYSEDPNKIKICTKCNYEGKASEFEPGRNRCKKCLSDYGKVVTPKWRANNAEHVMAYGIRYYEQNKTRLSVQKKKWVKLNIVKVYASNRNRIAHLKSVPGQHSAEDIVSLHTQQLGLCTYCRTELGTNYHVDHIIPLSREGSSNWPSNLQLLCPQCNCSKHDKNHEEYLEYRRYRGLPVFDNQEAA